MHIRNILTAAVLMASISFPAIAAEPTVTYRSLAPAMALKAAQAALVSCRDAGYQVAVAVVDHSGIVQVVLRDRYAGAHTLIVAKGKAWTVVTFRTETSDLFEATKAGTLTESIRLVPGVVTIGGGLMIQSAGQLIGGIGVSGAPGGTLDEDCAQAGLDAIEDDLGF